ncbi:MAG: NAD-dependent epimerase/dehydratase family protein [Flavobacteriales bacterium]|nr:NAD-dependent epimerase/dehydratase family protein [Flavobacteriales bacterium]
MSKILITGGAGFIGSAMARKLAEFPGDQIVIVDNLLTGRKENIPGSPFGNIRFIKGDVNDFNDISGVFFAEKFDYVFHYAAMVGVKRTLNNPVSVLKDIDGIKNILNLSKNTGVKRVYFSSSSEVYGEPFEIPQNESTTPLNSRLPYAIVKNVGEAYLRSYQQEFGLEYTIFRFFNTYGVNQSKDFVISKFLDAALNNRTLTIYGDGEQTRTFCYIDDNVDACERIFRQNEFVNDVVNIGSDVETPIIELAQRIVSATDAQSAIEHLPPLKEGDMTRRRPDNTKMKEILNRELIPLDQGIQTIIDSLKPAENVWN